MIVSLTIDLILDFRLKKLVLYREKFLDFRLKKLVLYREKFSKKDGVLFSFLDNKRDCDGVHI